MGGHEGKENFEGRGIKDVDNKDHCVLVPDKDWVMLWPTCSGPCRGQQEVPRAELDRDLP